MRELLDILERVEALLDRGGRAALATVIATRGSTYRRPGARLLITPNANANANASVHETVGAVSAGCLEEEVRAVGLRVLQKGKPERLRFDTTEAMDKLVGTGLGCRGTIDVLVEPLDAERADAYLKLRRCLREDRPCTLGLEVGTGRHVLFTQDELLVDELGDPALLSALRREAEALPARRPTALLRLKERDGVELYVERVEPPLKLIVCGAGHDAQPLVSFAKELGFRVTVVDPRPQYLTGARFPWADHLVLAHPDPDELHQKLPLRVDGRTAVVVMTHHYERDKGFLSWALRSGAFYVGQMGPRARTDELLTDIERESGGPLPDGARAKLYGPVGLDVGAETPEEIALSVLSEILAVKNGRPGRPLRERRGPIHPSPSSQC